MSMKALVYTGKQEVVYRDEPAPVSTDNEVLVAIKASGICGSDMHAYHGHDERRVPPLILGHEAAGIATSGKFKDRAVAINPITTCGNCLACLSGRTNVCSEREIIGMRLAGAFAEYVSINESNLIAVPEGLGLNKASLMEPAAVSLHSVVLSERVLARPLTECSTLVLGAGAIGLLAALVLQQKGAREIYVSEPSETRRSMVAKQVDCKTFDPRAKDQPANDSFDLVIDAVGSGITRADASRFVSPGGVISHIGLQDNEAGLDTRKLTLQEVTFIGNYTYTATDLIAALQAIADGSLGSLDWLDERPMTEGSRAFGDLDSGDGASPKIILIP